MRWLRGAVGSMRRARMVAAVLAGCVGLSGAVAGGTSVKAGAARAGTQQKTAPLSAWEAAEQGRDALEAISEETRSKADYTRAMDGYRAIYHESPRDVHAAAAIYAVAELLAEQGRGLHDAKSLTAAVGQYEFMRKQYPTSSLQAGALLAEAQIEQNDLNDAAAAREKYQLLLKEHPRSEQAEEARAGLASLSQGTQAQGTSVVRNQGLGKTRLAAPAPAQSTPAPAPAAIQAVPVGGQRAALGGGSTLPAMAQTSGTVIRGNSATATPASLSAGSVATEVAERGAVVAPTGTTALGSPIAVAPTSGRRSGRRALVTGIRHWSTATYTRVAIDLGDSVTYEAARVPNPDRIYFDLHGTKLAPELVGKSFAVTDDGFLKKVRAAQYSDDVTRVVLDVNDVTEYSAFLLPNPYRLIIDIHGSKVAGGSAPATTASGQAVTSMGAAMAAGPAAAMETPAPRAAVTVKSTVARPVPNSVATSSANASSEVADLSDLPGRVQATAKPTSKPISAVVADAGSRDAGSGNKSGGDAVSAAVAAPSDALPAASTNSLSKPRKGKGKAAVDATPARAAVPTADGQTSLVRALGLKIGRIVIDAGHGGHDSGTLGVDGIEEKDVVLDVALRLGKLLHDRLGAEIIYTRSDDTFIPLETRTAIANKAQADLFLSIHANSSSDSAARGVETYYLNFTSDPTALDVAARENAVSDQSIHQLSDLVKKIALKDKIAESREFASDVEGSLYTGLQKGNVGLKDRGVKKAPFVVLIGANMPSILAEISFVTNPKDAEQLREPEYRERVAESLYKGVAKYEGGLSGGTHVPTERASAAQ
ncbi:MAG: N-acetylmuramoyl-L-alanine amidase [Acidobacteriaceae bacterium]|nr:N-acetylmuramoyl-L-alanine amidase [Acidobacteriaceae bacterium]